MTLGLLDSVRQKAQEGDIFDSTLLRTLRKGVTARIPDTKDGTLKEMHHAFLLIKIGLVRQVVEGQDRVIPREHSSDQRRAIEIMAA